MKIEKIVATPVRIPIEPAYAWALGIVTGFDKTIVEVYTDEGVIGLGEGVSADLANIINNTLAPMLIGKDPLNSADCELSCLPEWKPLILLGGAALSNAFGAIDMAFWDIRGKVANMPLYQLLGGAYRKDIPFTEYYIFHALPNKNGTWKYNRDPEAVVDYCLRMREENGSNIFEGKFGDPDIWTEIKTLRKMREALGEEAVLRVDSNYGWSKGAMRTILRELEPLNIDNYEDPAIDFEDMAELRKHSSISFSTHVCDLRRGVTAGGPDNFVGHPCVFGGIMNTVRFAGACEKMGKGFWFYSGDAGIATACYMHLHASQPNMYQASQALFRWQPYDVIEGGTFQPKNNILRVPEGPGLGVTLDRKSLKKLHDDFVNNGPSKGYDNPKNPPHFQRCPVR